MTVSVAMCTYNGARYIQEQLSSILSQTRKVDEVVICDDGSTDGTLDVLQRYSDEYSCIRYCVNEKNKGFKQNFFDAMRLCTGDIVFFSDQDDIWHPDKVEKVLRWFDKHPKKHLLFTNAMIIDENSYQTGETIFERIGFDKEKQKAALHGFMMDILYVCNRATGATMAIKKDFINNFKEDWYATEKFHDCALVMEAMGEEVGGFIAESLMDYRLHASNNAGMERVEDYYLSPYMPIYYKCGGEKRWTKRVRKQIDFSLKRTTFKYSWFGAKVFFHLFVYICLYGSLWYKAFLYDLKDSILHSKQRIERKFYDIHHHL